METKKKQTTYPKIKEIRDTLQQHANPLKNSAIYYKTGPGQYAAHDKFMGITVPTLRKIAKDFLHIDLPHIQEFISSEYNEERLFALFILGEQYKKTTTEQKETLYNFYKSNLKHVNNWNLVDSSAHIILGPHLYTASRASQNWGLLYEALQPLVLSPVLWERRISIVATWYFIKQGRLEETFKIARILLDDEEDLIHKAVGWMLREAGKINETKLMTFLEKYATLMPRTMLRYSIEKFPPTQKKYYLNLKA
jgi:3-methyladenine DNA glycosylase AlkD